MSFRALLNSSLACSFLLLPTIALAEGEIQCEAGQKKVSFSDGNSVSEVCVNSSEMEATVANPEIPVGVDPLAESEHSEG